MLRQDELAFIKALFYFTDEAGDGLQEEGAKGVCREAQHHIRKWEKSFPTSRGQA